MTTPTLAPELHRSLLTLEGEGSGGLAIRQDLEQRLARRIGMILVPLAVIRDTPALAVVALMPLAALLFAGLFLGELIGAVLGIYFAGINIIFLRNKTPSTRTMPLISGQCLDLIPEKP